MRGQELMAAVLAAGAVAGCAASTPAAGNGLFGAPATAEGALVGVEWQASILPNSDGVLPGNWLLAFNGDGSVVLYRDGHPTHTGTYEADGREVRIDNDPGNLGCPRRTALYYWTVRAHSLEMRPRNERCQTVAGVMRTARWERR